MKQYRRPQCRTIELRTEAPLLDASKTSSPSVHNELSTGDYEQFSNKKGMWKGDMWGSEEQ